MDRSGISSSAGGLFAIDTGRVVKIRGANQDITERKLAETALRESGEQLRQIIDLVPHMIFVKDWEGKYLLANKAVAEAYNASVGALTGKCHADFHPDESELQDMLRDDREVMMKGEAKFIPEESYTDTQGNLRFLQTTKVPFHALGDKTPAVLGVAIDITNKKLAEQTLRESEEKFFLVFRKSPLMAAITALEDGTYLDVNDKFIEVRGFTRTELLGRTSVEVGWLRAEDRHRLIGTLHGHGRSSGIECTSYAKDGRPIDCLYHCDVVNIAGVERLLTMALDITERKQADEALRVSLRFLELVYGHTEIDPLLNEYVPRSKTIPAAMQWASACWTKT